MRGLIISIFCLLALHSFPASGEFVSDYELALRRAQYLLNGTIPTDNDFERYGHSEDTYRLGVRELINDPKFYNTVLRYHQRIFGTGLDEEYLEELLRTDIDGKEEKFASITCERMQDATGRFRCIWTSHHDERRGAACPLSAEQAVSVFWYPGIVAWVCPSVVATCGADLSQCFVRYANLEEARNSELGTTEAFDSRFAVINSLSRQAAGLATAVVYENYPYTQILEPGLTAIDGAVAHFYRQSHHFKIDEMNLHPDLIDLVRKMPLTDTRFQLLKTGGNNYSSAGILTSFGWLRRYENNRTRASELYQRLLCREFSSELPRVFPQDPGNLRETEGCSGCHAILDPLADFFLAWGEGANLYLGEGNTVDTYFNNRDGRFVAELADIVREDQAFSTCAVQNVWGWMIGRRFYADEEPLRSALNQYFESTNYSFKELVFAIATHPVFLASVRGDAAVTDPLEQPPLGQAPNSFEERSCDEVYSFADDLLPRAQQFCTGCHNPARAADNSQTPSSDLTTQQQWLNWGRTSADMMGAGQMPPGPQGAEILEFREIVRCWLDENGA